MDKTDCRERGWNDHPIRDRMLELQAAGEDVGGMPVEALAAALGIDPARALYHRQVLEARGMI